MTQIREPSCNGASEFIPSREGAVKSTTASEAESVAARKSAPSSASAIRHNCDILLNNFQIKKKPYRVLLNYDHIVWDAAQRSADAPPGGDNAKKDVEVETEQLSHKAKYGSSSNVVHIDEIIRVTKGSTKSDTLRIATPIASDFEISPTNEQPTPIPNPTEQYLTIHYGERVVKSAEDCNRWRLRSVTLYNSDGFLVKKWHTALEKLISQGVDQRLRIKRLLVFINPYGGRKQALHVYEKHCKPVFQLAGIDASCLITQRANQIRDILLDHDLTPYDAVCCVGGDGTVAEVINGLIFRRLSDLGMDPRRPDFIPKPALPVGIIPAGSTDTIAYSLHGTSDARTAAVHVVLGQRRGLDISSVRNRDGIIRFCASVLSYGYLGDVAAKSEKYRWMGTKRYEYTGVKAFLLNRGYEAEIRILMPNENDAPTPHPTGLANLANSINRVTAASTDTVCYANCQRCSIASSLQQEQVDSCETDEDLDDELPSSSNLTLTAPRSIEDINTASVTKPIKDNTKVANNIIDSIDYVKNINSQHCDEHNKNLGLLENHMQKDKAIKALLKDSQECDKNSTEYRDTDDRGSVQLRNEVLNVPLGAQNSISLCSSSSINDNNNSTLTSMRSDISMSPKWKIIKGEFFMISGTNITCACSRSPNGISRFNHLGDGHLDLVLVRKTSRWNNVRLIINTMGKNGDIRNLPFVEVYRTRKFHFRSPFANNYDDYSLRGSCQPIANAFPDARVDDTNVSSWNCDGEVVHDLDIIMSSHCQLVDVFMRGPFAYTKPQSINEVDSTFCSCLCNK